MELPNISLEQEIIVEKLRSNNNVVTDSVPGSGKTTCSLFIATNFPDKNILLLTYSSRLKLETRNKIEKLGLKNLEVHSFHSFAVKYYDNGCKDDNGLENLDKINIKHRTYYDLIILDEIQDMRELLYKATCKFFKDNSNKNCLICIFGDKNQSIHQYAGSDYRYIKYYKELFNFNNYEWISCYLSETFRMTKAITDFVNFITNENRIKSNKYVNNNKPRYVITDAFYDSPLKEFKYYLNKGYKPSDIFILAPSIKRGNKNSPICILENNIKQEYENTINIYIPINDEEKLDETLLENKLVFANFHQVKGLERKVIIIFSFDESYFNFYAKDEDKFNCPNTIYVACTRSLNELSLIHHYKNDYFAFIEKDKLKTYCEVIGNMDIYISTKEDKYVEKEISVLNLTEKLDCSTSRMCYNLLNIKKNEDYIEKKICLTNKITRDNTYESVSEINGIAIPCFYEMKNNGRISILESFKDIKDEKFKNDKNLQGILKKSIHNINISDILKLSNLWNSYKTGYDFKKYQITDYNWISEEECKKCIYIMNNLNISKSCEFEKIIDVKNYPELMKRILKGAIDCIDNDNNIIYEFKCKQQLEQKDFIQLAIYMYIYEKNKSNNYENNLINIESRYNSEKNMIEKDIDDKQSNKLIIGDNIEFKFKKQLNKKISKSLQKFLKLKSDNEVYIETDDIYEGKIINIYNNGNLRIDIKNDKPIIVEQKSLIIIENEDIKNLKINNMKDKLKNLLLKFENDKKINELNNTNSYTKYILFNILSNEYYEIIYDSEKIKKLIEILFESKFNKKYKKSDEEFLNENLEKYRNIIN